MNRLAHFSDIHVTAQPLGWALGDWFNKRFPGWLNLLLSGRGRSFGQADVVLTALLKELRERQTDRLIFSGDATALGFETEFVRAVSLLGLGDGEHLPGLAVPGNHDYYTHGTAAAGHFEKYFSRWQQGERVDHAVYPFAQPVGDAWLVAVNSCTSNRLFWDASGRVDRPQLERLDLLLSRLPPGPRILVTHYPLCLRSGKVEGGAHGLRNRQDLVDVAASGGVRLWLHGHRHSPYLIRSSELAPFPAICAGSATQRGLWSYHEYTLSGFRLQASRRVFIPQENVFRAEEDFELDLA